MTATASAEFADRVLALMKSRRVCRSFTDEPVSDDGLRKMTEAARWATSGGNRHLHKFLIVRDPERIRLVRSVSPGMLAPPPALIVILTDLEVAKRESLQLDHDHANWMDVGTAAMNMMNVAHALGLGTCPVTSFSRSGAAVMLDLPPHLIPEWILIVGHPKPQARSLRAGAPKPITARDLTYWERPGKHEP
jgi:nitroreductase